MIEMITTGPATWIATLVHHGQLDKAGQPYLIAHVADVVARMPVDDLEGRVVAWLHDVLEDSEVPVPVEALIRRIYGDDIGDAVVAITHRPGEPRDDYYARVKADPIALRVKVVGDIPSNTDPARTALLDPATRDRLAAKYAHALEVLT